MGHSLGQVHAGMHAGPSPGAPTARGRWHGTAVGVGEQGACRIRAAWVKGKRNAGKEKHIQILVSVSTQGNQV